MSPRFGKSPRTRVREESPFNCGPEPAAMAASFVTPNDLFFVRNHGDVPVVDPAAFRLEIKGLVPRPLALSLEDLADRCERRRVVATLQCAGNRRDELIRSKPIAHELPWGFEAASNAEWEGWSLSDLLSGLEIDQEAAHVAFCGLDETERRGKRFHFGGSIPMEKALGPEVLLADRMNGEPLPAVHGAPLRAVVPGYIGARSVKWLHKIELRPTPSDNYFQSVAYRLFPAAVGPDDVVWESGMMLGEQAVNSWITAPEAGQRSATGAIRVQGIALAGGGREIVRVELSTDGGRSWAQTTLLPERARWSWRRWEIELDLASGAHELAVRAWDSAGQTQPATVDEVWNFKGYMNNAWARISIAIGAGGSGG